MTNIKENNSVTDKQKKTDPTFDIIQNIASEIAVERLNQVETWGQQDHPSSYGESDRRQAERTADHWKAINAARVELDVLAWDGILLEEVYEALAEIDPLLRRQELVQVAAVAAAEIESIDRAIEAGVYEGFEFPEDEDGQADEGVLL
jgi:hypothetical protein